MMENISKIIILWSDCLMKILQIEIFIHWKDWWDQGITNSGNQQVFQGYYLEE